MAVETLAPCCWQPAEDWDDRIKHPAPQECVDLYGLGQGGFVRRVNRRWSETFFELKRLILCRIE
jgi:hypothetical protein